MNENTDEELECTGLFQPCFQKVTHMLEDPDGRLPSVPFCEEHWAFQEELAAKLNADPAFRAQFELALDKAEAGGEQ